MLLFKLQIGCIILLSLIFILYEGDKRKLGNIKKVSVFECMLVTSLVNLVLDLSTVYTVNHLETVSPLVNKLLHLGFLISIDAVIFIFFYYILTVTDWIHEQDRMHRFWIWIPLLLNCVIAVVNINTLEYRVGKMSNYSMGISAYTCFITAFAYVLLTIFMLFRRLRYIERDKRRVLAITLCTIVAILLYQMIIPDSLITSLGITIIVVMIYANMENPAKKHLDQYHDEMIMGVSNIIESRDGSTGGHVKRTTAYVGILATELRKRGYYTNILTKDYITNMTKAAAMHDIGKITTPDAILQKPGRLTQEEFAIMKEHTVEGGKIIRKTLAKLDDEDYINMAYDVAMYHHEQWDGKGYPEGLSGTQIPLAARIMAVADVFDAVAEKRCYREAMSLEQSFQILQEGMGTQFQAELVECFLEVKDKVVEIHDQFR